MNGAKATGLIAEAGSDPPRSRTVEARADPAAPAAPTIVRTAHAAAWRSCAPASRSAAPGREARCHGPAARPTGRRRFEKCRLDVRPVPIFGLDTVLNVDRQGQKILIVERFRCWVWPVSKSGFLTEVLVRVRPGHQRQSAVGSAFFRGRVVLRGRDGGHIRSNVCRQAHCQQPSCASRWARGVPVLSCRRAHRSVAACTASCSPVSGGGV